MKKLGELLKEEREKKGLTLHEIGMSLKINPKILKAIEESETKNLPAKTFLRGFVRSYAQYLRLDLEQIMQVFQQENEAPKPTPVMTNESGEVVQPSTPIQPSPSVKTPASSGGGFPSWFGSSRFYASIGVILLFALIIFVAQMIQKYERESQIISKDSMNAVQPPIEITSTTQAPIDSGAGGTPPAEGSSAVAAAALQSTSSTLAAIGVSSTQASRPTPSTTILPTTTVPRTMTSVPPTPSTTTTTTTLATTTPTLAKPTTTTVLVTTTTRPKAPPVEVIVEALNSVTIKYTLPGGAQQSLELTADQIHTFKARGPIAFDFSDGGAINLIVNGKDRGVPGNIGSAMKMTLP